MISCTAPMLFATLTWSACMAARVNKKREALHSEQDEVENSTKRESLWELVGTTSKVRIFKGDDAQGTLIKKKEGFSNEGSAKSVGRFKSSMPSQETRNDFALQETWARRESSTDPQSKDLWIFQGSARSSGGCCSLLEKDKGEFLDHLFQNKAQLTFRVLSKGVSGMWSGAMPSNALAPLPHSRQELWQQFCGPGGNTHSGTRKLAIPLRYIPSSPSNPWKPSDLAALSEFGKGMLYLKYTCHRMNQGETHREAPHLYSQQCYENTNIDKHWLEQCPFTVRLEKMALYLLRSAADYVWDEAEFKTPAEIARDTEVRDTEAQQTQKRLLKEMTALKAQDKAVRKEKFKTLLLDWHADKTTDAKEKELRQLIFPWLMQKRSWFLA